MRSVPLLPCSSIDEAQQLWEALGFDVRYRQSDPRGYLALVGGDGGDLHYFEGAESNLRGTCVIVIDDPAALFDAWTEALAQLGTDARLVAPHRDDDRIVGFTLVDSFGNRIRVIGEPSEVDDEPDTTAAATLAPPDPATAVSALPAPGEETRSGMSTYERHGVAAAPHHRFSALIYLAELSVRLGRLDDARAHLAAAEEIIPDSPAIDMVREGMAALG